MTYLQGGFKKKQAFMWYNMTVLKVIIPLLLLVSCSPKIQFKNSYSRSLFEIMSEKFVAENATQLPGYGVHTADLFIWVDGAKFEATDLKDDDTTPEQKVEKGDLHAYRVDFDLVVTNHTGTQPVSIDYEVIWENRLEEYWEDIENYEFNSGDIIDLKLDVIDDHY